MSPLARLRLPADMASLTKPELLHLIDSAGVGAENERIARMYFVDRIPQVDIAAETLLARATIQRRLPKIITKMELASKHLKS